MNISLLALVAAMAYLMNAYGVSVPTGAGVFNIIAATGAMTGYALAEYFARGKRAWKTLWLLVAAVVTTGSFVGYVSYIESSPSGVISMSIMAYILMSAFAGLGFTAGCAKVMVSSRDIPTTE